MMSLSAPRVAEHRALAPALGAPYRSEAFAEDLPAPTHADWRAVAPLERLLAVLPGVIAIALAPWPWLP